MKILSIGGENFEQQGYTCVCGQKNWLGTSCTRCGRPDPDQWKYNYPV
ncbi:hypothetical protein [Vibrio phage nt-1]|uniref:Uncharacterized protein n=1 Tax=Vibrio phage nt-1 TaxID=115992 RepID=A0A068J947_9CAUD|nr:hypothetical protein VPFG_p10 [Vibrio phage nt-1]AIE13782.1 hypothetical protein [Vibrio phage nt-1]